MMASIYSNTKSNNNIVKLLIDNGADPNIQDNNGWTALMLASRNSNTYSCNTTIKILLEAGADINATACDGWTALLLACRFSLTDSSVETVELLLDNDPDLTFVTKCGKTIYDIINKHNKKLKDVFHKREITKLENKLKATEKKLQKIERELEFYKTSFDLHPDGLKLSDLKDQFF